MADKILEIRGLRKSYRSENEDLTVLAGVDLDVFRGETLVVTGKSGCGKSTLLNLIEGIDVADAGEIVAFFAGEKFRVTGGRSKSEYRRRFVSPVFQFHYLLKDFTALENVEMPALISGANKKAAEEKAMSLLQEVGLEGRAQHFPSQLSGGERQRVAVARSLVNEPELILADEPTGSLDRANAETVFALLFTLVERKGKTLILVTHDSSAQSLGDRHLTLENGFLKEI